jgi:hypothetical protein
MVVLYSIFFLVIFRRAGTGPYGGWRRWQSLGGRRATRRRGGRRPRQNAAETCWRRVTVSESGGVSLVIEVRLVVMGQ